MNKTEMNDQVFEILLKAAVEEEFEREVKKLPKEENIADNYELSLPVKSKIKKMIRKSYFLSVRLRMGKITKRAAMIVAILIPFYVGSLLSVDASRNVIFNALLSWKSDHANVLYQDSALSSAWETSSSGVAEPQYLPKGFEEYERTKSGSVTETEYRNEQGVKILLSQGPLSSGGNIGVDTEHTTETEIEIQGEKAFLFTANSGENSYLVWDNQKESFLLISAISPQELVKIAKSMEE